MDATDQVISVLESRVSDLEQKIIGDSALPAQSNSICDNLLLADSSISAVLSSHEKASAVMKRLKELDQYQDPMFEEMCNVSKLEAMEEIILASWPLMQQKVQMGQQLKELMPITLNSTQVKDVVQLSAQLEKLTLSVLHGKENLDEVSARVMSLLQQYSEVVSNLEELCKRWDGILSKAEHSLFTKKDLE